MKGLMQLPEDEEFVAKVYHSEEHLYFSGRPCSELYRECCPVRSKKGLETLDAGFFGIDTPLGDDIRPGDGMNGPPLAKKGVGTNADKLDDEGKIVVPLYGFHLLEIGLLGIDTPLGNNPDNNLPLAKKGWKVLMLTNLMKMESLVGLSSNIALNLYDFVTGLIWWLMGIRRMVLVEQNEVSATAVADPATEII
ncbi:hypothetical protein FNV43_RR20174 [Rhamnella rubrinervis]|uniref:Uncharacterized protein n=1 Tax=Rhamnella rubrinervis TaxID=2594499 RepID=A0A8K0DVG2_9ROSA|nr:hypothetical protein FNV43_RR20174 [Rhamnella rubrinervis]